MEKNRKLMKNLVDISAMVTQSTNFFEIKDQIVDKMLEVVEPTKACINLFYDNNFEHAYLVCSATLDYIPKAFPQNSKIGTKLDFKESYPEYIHEAVEQKKIIYIEDIFESPKAIDERELAQMEGYKGRIVFPLVLNYNVIGFMTCFLTEEDSLEELDITFISSVVSLIALSIEITFDNEHTKELIDKLRESISNINEITTKLHLNNDVNEFMESLNTQAKRLTKSDEAFIIIDDLNYDYKIFSAMENRKRKKIDFQKILLELSQYNEDGDYVNNTDSMIIDEVEVSNYMYYKLKDGNKLLGCILCSNNSQGYTEDDFNILELISKQIVLGMQLYKYNQAETKHKLIANELNILNKQQKLIMNESEMNLENDKDLYFYHRPATVIGGDFYHAQVIDENKVAYIIADVMGHGIVSNYIVAMIKGCFKTLCYNYQTAAEIMNKLNQILYDEFDKMDVFTTCIVGIIDSKNNTLEISNAGHYCPIIIDNFGNIQSAEGALCKKNVPLGVLEDINYQQSTICIKDSSMICMYTDGIIEIKNQNKEEFGIERFESFLSKNYKLKKDDFIAELKKELENFVPKHNFDDDILVVCLSNK
ncbi:GAF domain-containing SpoIIE family protein phosphatase [Intestinibacter bartlettii]|uniref:SpoIIE family protein phosphatase n=1 Tax=Intestinibacter bartlettii TaxID=261299 RepID=A0ABS6DYX9_9FIRM|nr:SpoIIE family protein phosphatase [Intestinibacter bartlettii]MBU5337048.1 SpoIIE family protein phosphatase [Intestinibacter bartlettii]MDO5009997.1 SpoIIE family protein phosphatase [Intestinibacter bartlettii]